MQHPDPVDELQPVDHPVARRTLDPAEPAVVAGPGHAQHSADHADLELGIGRLLRVDVVVDDYRSVRRAKKASAFPRISSSSSLRASSRSRRRTFALSDSSSESPALFLDRFSAAARLSAARTQFEIDVAARLNSLASSTNVRP